MGQADLDSSEKWAYGCPVGREVGEIPSDQWARCHRSLEASDEWVAIDGLDNLVSGLHQWWKKKKKFSIIFFLSFVITNYMGEGGTGLDPGMQ